MKKIPIIYIAGPFRSDDTWELKKNIYTAEAYGKIVIDYGAMPFIPHSNTGSFYGAVSEEFMLEGDLEMLRRSDAVWVTRTQDAKGRLSAGVSKEIDEALLRHIDVLYNQSAFLQWLKKFDEKTKRSF